jgi:hypothetical protein
VNSGLDIEKQAYFNDRLLQKNPVPLTVPITGVTSL